jgi:hypothetical protein
MILLENRHTLRSIYCLRLAYDDFEAKLTHFKV